MENEEQVPIYWALATLGPQVSPQTGTQAIFPETPIPSLMSPGHIGPWWPNVTPDFISPIKSAIPRKLNVPRKSHRLKLKTPCELRHDLFDSSKL